jgi:hypothetical protein
MEPVETTMVAGERVRGDLGDGVRLYNSDDTVYELRVEDGLPLIGDTVETRLYQDGNRWQAKLRIPETDLEDAYDHVLELSERIEEEYGFDPSMPVRLFNDGIRHDIGDEIDGQFRFNDASMDEYGKEYSERHLEGEELLAMGGGVGYLGSGLVGGGVAGSLLGPPGTVAGAVLGAAGGLGAWVWDMNGAQEGKNTPINLVSKAPGKTIGAIKKRQKENERSGKPLKDMNFLEQLNEKRHIEPDYQDARDWDLRERYEALEEKDLEDRFDTAMDATFHRLEQAPGLHLTASFDDYGEALDFLATAQGAEAPETDTPSVYDNPDAFSQIFRYSRDEDRRRLIRNVQEDGSESVEQYLEDEHEGLMIDVCAEN